ncbi:MAG: class I SAM-dependent methyltransferase [Methanocellales archaeon]|nr:class I SAM-dependent methyltransferase [Methanocellales archaeon]MDD3291872.1 class I SAM-dependent methyltransferase [Methanocellales archaeon]MDD5235515.1 class I SAM-dependent methyltransferase [Methanocellales archaeon]MDD5485134.1 class I SAM-dependent methyltransferase [Methanocellales archaeon]
MNELVCPLCKGNINAINFQRNIGKGESEVECQTIKEGVLACDKCKLIYPIINYIPIMLDFPTNITTEFLGRYNDKLEEFKDYTIPNNKPRPGEVYIQKAFSKQWEAHGTEQEFQYGYTEDELRYILKIELGLEADWFKDKMLLNVGCGAGREAIMIYEYTKSTVVGIDLNFSLLNLGEKTVSYPDLHFVQASLFNLPFRERAFDYVFSHGVIHHTYSTEEAFKCISKFVKSQGYIYIWVYGIRKVKSLIQGLYVVFGHHLVRPLIAKSPTSLQTVGVFPIVLANYLVQKIQGKNPNWNDLWLQKRDSYAVYYLHWHWMAEVIVWLKEAGMSNITPLEIEKIPRDLWGSLRENVGLRAQYTESKMTNPKEL